MNVRAVVTRPDGSPMQGVKVEFVSTETRKRQGSVLTSDNGGQVNGEVDGPFFVRARVSGDRHRILVTLLGAYPCWDYVVDANGFGTHETLAGSDGAWAAAVAALSSTTGDRSIWMCNSETLSAALPLGDLAGDDGILIGGPGVSPIGGDVVLSAPSGGDMFTGNPANECSVTIQNVQIHVDSGFGLFAKDNGSSTLTARILNCYLDMAGAAITTNRNGVNGNSSDWYVEECFGVLGTFYEYNNTSGNGQDGAVYIRDCRITVSSLWKWDSGASGFKTGPNIFEVDGSELTISTQQPLNRADNLGIKDTTLIYNVASALFAGAMNTMDRLVFQNLRFRTTTSGAALFNATGTPDHIYMVNVLGYSTTAQAGTFITIDSGATVSFGSIFAPDWATVFSGPSSTGGAPVYNHTHEDNTHGGTVSHDDLVDVSTDDHHNKIHAIDHEEGGGDELDVGDLSSGTATDGQIPVADGVGGIAWETPVTAGAGIITMLADSLDNEWTDMPAALTELFGQTHHRTKIDLSNASTVRMVARIETAGAAGAELRAQYSTDESTWNYLDGGTGPTVAIDATGVEVSATVDLAAGAKDDVFLRIVGIDGDGATDPVFGHITLQFDAVGGGGGGGSGSLLVQKDDVDVDTAVTTMDFEGDDFEVTSSPAGEVNISAKRFYSVQVFRGAASTTFNVNNTSYVAVIAFGFNVDLDWFPFTHYRILVSGASNQAAQTVTAQLATVGAPGTPVHTGGNDVVINNAGSLYDSGWLTRDDGATGVKEYDIALKGSNGTVDLTATYVEVLLKTDR